MVLDRRDGAGCGKAMVVGRSSRSSDLKFLWRNYSTNHSRPGLLGLFSLGILLRHRFTPHWPEAVHGRGARRSCLAGIQRRNSDLHYVFRLHVTVGYRELCAGNNFAPLGKPRWCDLLAGTLPTISLLNEFSGTRPKRV